jgi:acylphosphatase
MSDMATGSRRLHATVYGRVQGVNFRAYTRREAVRLGLTGWVRNMPNDTVETVAEGSEDSLTDFVEFLHRGSPSASVSKVDVEWQASTNEFTDFQVRYF